MEFNSGFKGLNWLQTGCNWFPYGMSFCMNRIEHFAGVLGGWLMGRFNIWSLKFS